MSQYLIAVFTTLMILVGGAAHAATNITFDDLPGTNPNYYHTGDGLYQAYVFGPMYNTIDLVHGNPPPAMGIPLYYPGLYGYIDSGINVQSQTLRQEFHWDELTVLGHPTYGVEYWIHAIDSDGRDIFVLHGIVFGAAVIQTPKSDAEMVQLWVLLQPTSLTNSRVEPYGAVDNIKLRAKGEKLPKEPEKCKRKCGQ